MLIPAYSEHIQFNCESSVKQWSQSVLIFIFVRLLTALMASNSTIQDVFKRAASQDSYGGDTKLTHGSQDRKGVRQRMTDLQVLSQIDSSEDPDGRQALKKIDFRSKGMSCGRKEFSSKTDAIRALEQSKSRVSELIHKARSQHVQHFKNAVGKVIKEDHMVSSMPRIRISAAKSLSQRNNTFIGISKRNFFQSVGKQEAQQILGGLTHGNLSMINGTAESSGTAAGSRPYENPPHANTEAETADAESDDQVVKTSPKRKNFARGISMMHGEKNNSQLRHMMANAPSAHYRFDKETVHLRNMYRQLYPGAPKPKTSVLSPEKASRGSYDDLGVTSKYGRGSVGRNQANGFSSSFSKHEPSNFPIQVEPSKQLPTTGHSPRSSVLKMPSILHNTPQSVDYTRSSYLGRTGSIQQQQGSTISPNKFHTPMNNIQTSYMQQRNSFFSLGQSSQVSQMIGQITTKQFLGEPQNRMVTQRLEHSRPKPKIIYQGTESSDEEETEQFHANPAEDIPRNKLVDKLVRGLQSYIQRMQKRESFRIDVRVPFESKWQPAPRECATLTTCGYKMFLMGGLNFDACKEIVQAKVNGDQVIWERIPYTSSEQIQGRQCHSSCSYNNKVYLFGGCFMFNKKRQVRECTNQLLQFDTYERTLAVCKTAGFSAGARKNHTATVYKKSMVVYGGQSESGIFHNDMIVCHLDHLEWMKITLKQGMAPFIQGTSCSVISSKSKTADVPQDSLNRKSDSILDGIYFFGGKNAKGELQNKLRYFKPVVIDGKVVHGEFQPLKAQGLAPTPRFGHTMSFLPVNSAILIAGGRNDSLSATNITPFLNDLTLFLLDQKVWLNVKYSVQSGRIDYIGNHSMAVVSDNESYEKILIFGGITNQLGDTLEDIKSTLSNKSFLITLNSRGSGKQLFKEPFGGQSPSALRKQPTKRLSSSITVVKAAMDGSK